MQATLSLTWLILLYSNAVHYFANKGLIGIYPKHIVFLGIVMFMVGLASKEIKPVVINNGFVFTNFLGIFITVVFYLFTMLSDRYIDSTAIGLELGVITFYLVCSISVICLSQSHVFKLARKLLIVLFVTGLVLNMVDFALGSTEIFSVTLGRASGLYINPNTSGLVLSLSYVLLHRDIGKSFRLLVYVLFVLAVVATASRAGLLYVALITLYLLVTGYFFIWSRRAIIFNAVVVVALIVSASAIQQVSDKVLSEISTVNRSFENRFQNLQDLFEGDESSMEISDDSRFKLLVLYTRHYLQSPVLGNGLGFSRSEQLTGLEQASHNMYLHLLNEYGLIGLLFYLYYIYKSLGKALRFKRSNYEPHLLLLILFAAGFFTHNLNRIYAIAILIAYASAKYKVFDGGSRSLKRYNQVIGN